MASKTELQFVGCPHVAHLPDNGRKYAIDTGLMVCVEDTTERKVYLCFCESCKNAITGTIMRSIITGAIQYGGFAKSLRT